jgi:hypothetical protein
MSITSAAPGFYYKHGLRHSAVIVLADKDDYNLIMEQLGRIRLSELARTDGSWVVKALPGDKQLHPERCLFKVYFRWVGYSNDDLTKHALAILDHQLDSG